ncbi:unnamed protein product [Bursaphelenchus xylophilus]|uniref:(pine wood nematode) hypothetical protein n=1 Tax=Bursaphelenchus xylophilus TaxID=6326 RepID=A0A1I7RKT4_BURXY|nr:unnamed protein product [Bursaphelenchus xylophilus]CAG9131109.1 unnamed protein product [Bursaphelenchus xylophilus]
MENMEEDPPVDRRKRKKIKKKKKNEIPTTIQRFEFAEMNIKHLDSGNTLELVKRAIRLGYDTVVINVDVGDLRSNGDSDEPPKKKKKKGNSDVEQKFDKIPDPFVIDESKLDLSQLEVNGKKFRQFSRLTVTLTDTTSIHKLQHHPKRPLYDIIAVRCLDEGMLTTMSRKGELIDIISLDTAEQDGRFQWVHKQKLIQACISEGLAFEISYTHALNESKLRRQTLCNAKHLYRISRKGKGIILSSGAESIFAMRGPFDTANLGILFGAKPNEGKRFISDNCMDVLLRSQSRRTVKGAFHAAELTNVPVPPNETKESHLNRLEEVPEFKEQMADVKSET